MTEPVAVTQFRLMLLDCASIDAAGIVSRDIYYPHVHITDENAEPTKRPYIVLAETASARVRYADGATGLPSGTIVATIYSEDDVGTLEDLARDVASELSALSTGLYLSSVVTATCSEPMPGAVAADEDTPGAKLRAIQIIAEHGLSP